MEEERTSVEKDELDGEEKRKRLLKNIGIGALAFLLAFVTVLVINLSK